MATLIVTVSGTSATFKVILEPSDPSTEWTVILCAAKNRGTGKNCSDAQCQYWVKSWWSGMPTSWTESNMMADHYCAVLDIVPVGNVDFATFDIGAVQPCSALSGSLTIQ